MQIHGWELLAVCHHSYKFGDHRYSDGGDIVFLICHLTSRDHMFKGLRLGRSLVLYNGHGTFQKNICNKVFWKN